MPSNLTLNGRISIILTFGPFLTGFRGGGGGGATFQLASDAVSDAMSHQRPRVFAYKDDYLLMSRADLAYSQFQDLSDLITDLGLPMNPDKKIPPTRRLTCLGVSTELGSTHIA